MSSKHIIVLSVADGVCQIASSHIMERAKKLLRTFYAKITGVDKN